MTRDQLRSSGTVVSGIGYPESPRWHDRQLWFTDLQRRVVCRWDAVEGLVDVVAVPEKPSGLALGPEGVFVVAMESQRVYRIKDDALTLFADLSHVAVGHLNDMVRGPNGDLYVGNFGYDLAAYSEPVAAPLWRITPDREVTIAAEGLLFANGMAFSPSGDRLLVAETAAQRLTSFAVLADGSLTDRKVFAHLDERSADGITFDATGAVWFGSPFTQEFVRLDAAGALTDVISTPQRWAIGCVFAEPTERGQTLYLATADTTMRRFNSGESIGYIEAIELPPSDSLAAVASLKLTERGST